MTPTPNLLEEAANKLQANYLVDADSTDAFLKGRAKDILREFAYAVVEQSIPKDKYRPLPSTEKAILANAKSLLGLTDEREL